MVNIVLCINLTQFNIPVDLLVWCKTTRCKIGDIYIIRIEANYWLVWFFEITFRKFSTTFSRAISLILFCKFSLSIYMLRSLFLRVILVCLIRYCVAFIRITVMLWLWMNEANIGGFGSNTFSINVYSTYSVASSTAGGLFSVTLPRYVALHWLNSQ